MKANTEDMSTEPSPGVSRSSVAPHDWSKCMFCKKITHKKENAMQKVSTFEAANNMKQCAEAKGDEDMLRLLLGVSYDLVAAEAEHYKACFTSCVSKFYLKSKAFKEETTSNWQQRKKIVPKNLYLFPRWMVTNDDIEVEFESSCRNDADERKIVCMAQDAIHCSSHGRVNFPKYVGLVMSVRHMTGSKQLVSILKRMGSCSSYDETESIDTGLGKEILAKSQ